MNKKLISTAVGASLALSAGLAQAAHEIADYILFPYVVKDSNRTTVITLIGSDGGVGTDSNQAIHLQYWTKSTTDANTAACLPSSVSFNYTENDMVSFDTAGLLGSGALFGDTTNNAPLGMAISYAGPRHGYATVYNVPDYFQSGFWMEIDLANGGAHGDSAIMENAEDEDDDDFTSTSDSHSLRAASSSTSLIRARAVPFWPASTVSTAFTVTPLGNAMETSDNTTVVLQVRNYDGNQGAYDRNENGIDGTVPQTVRCVGRLTAAQLMPGVVANAAWAATGGWGFLKNLGNGNSTSTENCAAGTGDCPASVYQVDTSNAAGTGKFMQNATRIATDNNEGAGFYGNY